MLPMSQSNSELFCSDACRNKMPLRSSGTCPDCGQRWNGQSDGSDRHYRNNAWKLCDSCTIAQGRCVVCGEQFSKA